MTTEENIARFTITTSKRHQRALAELAKSFKISQGEVVEVFLDNANMDEFATHFTRKRDEKVDMRAGADKALLSKLKKLTPEQLAMVEKMAAENQS